MIIAKWNERCWEIKSIPSRGKTPKISLRNHIVSRTVDDAVREIVLKRKQPICMKDLHKLRKNEKVCEI